MISRDDVFQLIANHDGTWGWYQLERIINPKDIPVGTSVMGFVKELMNEGLIVQLPTEPMPYYALTESGKARLGIG